MKAGSKKITGHAGNVTAVACSNTSLKKLENCEFRIFASGSDDNTIKLWKVTKNNDVGSLWTAHAHDDDINSLCFAPNDSILLRLQTIKQPKSGQLLMVR